MVAEPVLETADLRRSLNRFTVTEPIDADLLKDLEGLGKPPAFDGNDTDYQDFRFSFRMHMSLDSAISHTLEPGSWMSESGNVHHELFLRMQSSTQ